MSETNQPDKDSEKPGGKQTPEIRYVPVQYEEGFTSSEEEISLLDLIKMIWEGRRIVMISTAVVFTLALFVYLFGAREYESTAILIQEEQQNQSQLQLLAQQFGGLGGGNGANAEGVIPPSLYPRIIESADFMLGLVTHDIQFDELDLNTTPLIYFNEYYEPPITEKLADFLVDYTIKLPVTLYRGVRSLFPGSSDSSEDLSLDSDKDSRFLILNSEQRFAIREMSERVILEQNSNLVTFKVNMPDARASAELNEYVIEQIQDYVIDYRIEKYRQTLQFVENQMEDAKVRYEEAQLEWAEFRDKNVNINTAVARTQQEELQNRRNVTFNVYNSLAQEVEQARIRLQQETPVFNILQKPSLPHQKKSGSKLILILSVFLGLFFGIFMTFFLKVWNVVVENIITT